MRILYVEDTLLNLCLIERIARMGNHEVINYAYSEQALQNLERDKPDLALVDIRLEGDMSGLDFVQRIREEGHTMPVIAITALAGDDIQERCLAVGCNEYFPKPLPVREMVRLLQRYDPARRGQESTEKTEEGEPVSPTVKPATAKPAAQTEADVAENGKTEDKPAATPTGPAATDKKNEADEVSSAAS